MAASQDGKTFKQDMVVSIRYRNDLPPPPMPPKLLDIDTGGISQYLTTSYASNLARREMPNIDVDAEGGMPIDMVGIPGYFMGDESAIMAPEATPVLDPADAALMLTPEQLRSGGSKTETHSFLRKTQYISVASSRQGDPFISKKPVRKPLEAKNTNPVVRDDKDNIKRHIQKGFDLAYPESIPYNPPESKSATISNAERDAWRMPVHPDNKKLKPVAFYPVLPDLGARTDGEGKWNIVKFAKSPLPPVKGRRDDRIDTALLTGLPQEDLTEAWRIRHDAFERNPDKYEDPGPEPYVWSLSIPKDPDSAIEVRRMLNEADPEKDNPDWWHQHTEGNDSGERRLPFTKARVYPIMKQQPVDSHQYLALVLHDAGSKSQGRLRKQGQAAYYYPVMERDVLKTDRGKLGQVAEPGADVTENIPDEIMVLPRPEKARETWLRSGFRGTYDNSFDEEYSRITTDAQAEMAKEQAETVEEEQGTLHQGAQDTDMAEVEAADEMELVGNGGGAPDRDDANGIDSDADMDDE